MNSTERKIKQLTSQISRIEKQAEPLKKERQKYKDELALERNEQYLGKYFKFRNCYSCASEKDKWWLYIKVLSVTKDHIQVLEFQETIYHDLEIKSHTLWSFSDDYIPISADEFNTNFKKILLKIEGGNENGQAKK